MKAAKALDMPVLVIEQYPKALGATVPELQEVLPEGCSPIAKTHFSMCGMSQAYANLCTLDIMMMGLALYGTRWRLEQALAHHHTIMCVGDSYT